MKVAIGGAPFEVRMVELPASGIWTIDESALEEIWDALGAALAELGYRTEGIVMPQVKAFIMEDPGYVEFYNACKNGSEQWRAYNRRLHEEEH